MSDERRKTNRQSTGTVPKVKYRNNSSYPLDDRDRSRSLANNIMSYWHHSPNYTNFIRNPRRNQQNNYSMDTTLEEPTMQSVQNTSINFNQTANGILTPNSASSTSRRNSSGSTLKCDNVTKYPDKKQIEDKLQQIREYLKITNSLMSSMKNTDDQTGDRAEKENLEKMMNDLKDSEKKLVNILDQMNSDESDGVINEQLMENGGDDLSEHSASSFRRNDVDINLDNTNQEIDALKDQQLALMRLQQKAENKLKDAKQIQSKLLMAQYENDVNSASNRKDAKNYSDFDFAIKELEERAKRLKSPQVSNKKVQENILAKVESLHNQIISMHNANDEREQLIQTLDNRDSELRTHHVELQNKLIELQNKKQQVDQLVYQLQNFGDVDEEDVGGQVRKIVTMKDQLHKLKDMLEIVKTTENIMQNTNASPEVQAAACDICLTAEGFLEKDVQKPKLQSRFESGANVLRYDNDTSTLVGDSQPKQVNKNTREQSSRGVKPKIISISEKLALQAELEAKKKELEEIMGKHKASTSNLNHDVGADMKSEYSCTSNTVNDCWMPLIPQNHCPDSDRYSSDDCPDDDYSELRDNHNILTLPTANYVTSNTSKFRSESIPRMEYLQSDFDRVRSLSRTPERNIRTTEATSGNLREPPRVNSDQDNKSQVQKQLHLIKSVCDSMLEQQNPPSNPQSNVQQLRNNLTPSSLYSEPRRFTSPNSHAVNALNVVNPNNDVTWMAPPNNIHSNLNMDLNNYQNWLATNTIQTQSFMLNTLNQCCQMLWLQQRELVSLRNTVNMLQERLENNPYAGVQDPLASSLLTTPQDHRPTNQFRPNPNQKINHVSAAFSLPNLNQYNAPPSNLDPNYINQNNTQSSRILDPCLNNVNVNHLNAAQSVEHANNVLHAVNSNINHTLPNQMWNGQALNNQVAPGNRANNYWDNFRSYSRQNLLSTKNSEMLQNPTASLDRSNIACDRTNPFTLMSYSKINSEPVSTSASQEATDQRRTSRRENVNSSVIPPPDVLNINHNFKTNEQMDISSSNQQESDDINLGLQMLLNLNAYNDTCSNHSNISEEHIYKECISEQSKRRNEWNDETVEEQLPKTKLFDELRENVYKEVASLISANETRPHFLIQLFRDLQMIGSDSLRLKILQSIQMVITHSLMSSQNPNRLSLESQQTSSDHELTRIPENVSLQSTVWSKPVKNLGINRNVDISSEAQNTFKGALPFLNDHEDEIIQHSLLMSLKQVLLGSDSFKDTVKDSVFQKHFSNILDEVLEQYLGKRVRDVKMHLIQTLNELLFGELSFIQLIQETNPENYISHSNIDVDQVNSNYNTGLMYELQNGNSNATQNVNNMQNGDLAEADQSQVLGDDAEEEGAVGGVLEKSQEADSNTLIPVTGEEVNMGSIDFPCNAEGLDQVPTRLPTKVKSRSATPSRDRSNCHGDPDSESF